MMAGVGAAVLRADAAAAGWVAGWGGMGGGGRGGDPGGGGGMGSPEDMERMRAVMEVAMRAPARLTIVPGRCAPRGDRRRRCELQNSTRR